jgi:hypothetical protein
MGLRKSREHISKVYNANKLTDGYIASMIAGFGARRNPELRAAMLANKPILSLRRKVMLLERKVKEVCQ